MPSKFDENNSKDNSCHTPQQITLSKNLNYLLNQNKLSQTELSTKAGVNLTTINSWIRMKTKNPRYDLLKPVADFFLYTPEDLTTAHLYDTENIEPATLTEREKETIRLRRSYSSFRKLTNEFLNAEREDRLDAYFKRLDELL